jgi:hypothetical protein
MLLLLEERMVRIQLEKAQKERTVLHLIIVTKMLHHLILMEKKKVKGVQVNNRVSQ